MSLWLPPAWASGELTPAMLQPYKLGGLGGTGHVSAGPWNWGCAPACPALPLGEFFPR